MWDRYPNSVYYKLGVTCGHPRCTYSYIYYRKHQHTGLKIWRDWTNHLNAWDVMEGTAPILDRTLCVGGLSFATYTSGVWVTHINHETWDPSTVGWGYTTLDLAVNHYRSNAYFMLFERPWLVLRTLKNSHARILHTSTTHLAAVGWALEWITRQPQPPVDLATNLANKPQFGLPGEPHQLKVALARMIAAANSANATSQQLKILEELREARHLASLLDEVEADLQNRLIGPLKGGHHDT